MPLIFADRMILDEAPRRTADGYLVAMPKVARTGMQDYLASELGLTDRAGDSVVVVFRPESEVFHADALHSMAHRPITINHPPVLVDAKNWHEYARGQTGSEVVRDGEFIRVPMSLMDADAIDAVMDGKNELSMGYTAEMEWTPGEFNGVHYDAIQKNIRGNHLAIVDAARGGAQLRVIDSQTNGGIQMRKVTLDGISVEVNDTGYEVIQKYVTDAEAKAKTDMERMEELEDEFNKLKADMAKKDAESATKDAKIVTLESQLADAALTPQKLDEAVKARAQVIDAAKRLVPNVAFDAITDAEIRKAVVHAKVGDKAKDWTADQIMASFNTLTDSAPTSDPYRDARNKTNPTELKGRDLYIDRLANPNRKEA